MSNELFKELVKDWKLPWHSYKKKTNESILRHTSPCTVRLHVQIKNDLLDNDNWDRPPISSAYIVIQMLYTCCERKRVKDFIVVESPMKTRIGELKIPLNRQKLKMLIDKLKESLLDFIKSRMELMKQPQRLLTWNI